VPPESVGTELWEKVCVRLKVSRTLAMRPFEYVNESYWGSAWAAIGLARTLQRGALGLGR
jgi:hypothetical protein